MKNEQSKADHLMTTFQQRVFSSLLPRRGRRVGDEGVLWRQNQAVNQTSKIVPTQFSIFHSALLFALTVAFSSCNQLEKQAPTPNPTGQNRIALTSDSQGRATLPLASLGIDRTQPFTLTSSDFKHGRVILIADTGLTYRANAATGWQADSGTIRLCQQGQCRDRKLVVQNINRPIPQPLACISLPGLTRLVTAAGQSFSTNLPGMSEPGARIDSIWGFMASAIVSTDLTGFTYGPTGPNIFPNVAANDEVFYRVRRPANLGCYLSSVRFFYPDSCSYTLARQDEIGPPTLPFIHSPILLQLNDLNCANAPITNTVARLSIQPYTGSKKIQTNNRHAAVSDTIINGNQQFYYRRQTPGPNRDTLTYYLIDTLELRISRAQIILDIP